MYIFKSIRAKAQSFHLKWRKVKIMNKVMRTALFGVAIAIVATLAACGGGGGGTAPPPVTPTGTFSASAATCVIQQDVSTCQVPLTWASTDAVNPTVKKPDGGALATSANGTQAASVSFGANVFTFSFGGTDKTVTVTGSCVAGTAWNGKCAAQVADYSDQTVTTFTLKYPFKVTVGADGHPNGIQRFENMTPFVTLLNCLLADKPTADGVALAKCYETNSTEHVVRLDLVAIKLYEYSGTVPADIVWLDSQPFDPAYPNWGAKTHRSDGWVYTTNINTSKLLFEDNAGKVTTLYAGNFATEGNFVRLVTYNFKK